MSEKIEEVENKEELQNNEDIKEVNEVVEEIKEEKIEENEESVKEEKVSKIACIKEKFKKEVDEYNSDEDAFLTKWAKCSLKNLHFTVGLVAFCLVLLYMPLNFKFVSQIIGLIVLVFAMSLILITKYYIDNKDNEEIKLYIYDCWQKSVLSYILVSFALFIFSSNAFTEMIYILGFAAIASIIIQSGVKRSLTIL